MAECDTLECVETIKDFFFFLIFISSLGPVLCQADKGVVYERFVRVFFSMMWKHYRLQTLGLIKERVH